MSDFLSELRRDVVDAHGRHRRRGRLRRAVHRRVWRPATLLAAMAVAAGLVGAVVAVRFLAAPEHAPSRPQIVAVIPVGGTPVDAAFGSGSLWVTDFAGAVVRVDPGGPRVLARITVRGQPESIAAGADSVWVRSPDASGPPGGPLGTRLLHIDASTDRVLGRALLGGGSGLAVGADAVWVPRRFTMPEGLDRIDPATGARTGRIPLPSVDQVAVVGATVWVIQHDGTVAQIDAATGRIARRWPQLAPSDAGGWSAPVVADAGGAWVLSTVKAEILHIAGGRVVRRIPIARSARPLLTRARDGLWIASGDSLGRRNTISRIDPDTGDMTATLHLGNQRPKALVATDDGLCVLTADGKVLVIRS